MEKEKIILKQKITITGYNKFPEKEDIIPDADIPEGYTKYGEKLFDTPAEAWFWFMEYEKLKEYFSKHKTTSIWAIKRPCNADDIYIVVKRLYRQKIITHRELEAMVKYGDLGHEPNFYDTHEVNDWQFWETAMDKLYSALYKKGIVRRKQYQYAN